MLYQVFTEYCSELTGVLAVLEMEEMKDVIHQLGFLLVSHGVWQAQEGRVLREQTLPQ